MAIETEMCRQNTQELIQDNYPHSKDVVAFPSVGLNRGRDLKQTPGPIFIKNLSGSSHLGSVLIIWTGGADPRSALLLILVKI